MKLSCWVKLADAALLRQDQSVVEPQLETVPVTAEDLLACLYNKALAHAPLDSLGQIVPLTHAQRDMG